MNRVMYLPSDSNLEHSSTSSILSETMVNPDKLYEEDVALSDDVAPSDDAVETSNVAPSDPTGDDSNLKKVCPDTSVCLAIGIHSEEIKKYFNGFVNFSQSTEIEQVGEYSMNGFVKLFTYIDKEYYAYAILKSSNKPRLTEGFVPDNLLYEYIVGQYINEQNKRFPCFLETYGYYNYEDKSAWEDIKLYQNGTVTNKTIQDLTDSLKLHTSVKTAFDKEAYAYACNNQQLLAILIQYFKNPIDLTKYFDSNNNVDLVEFIYILFQIYYPLAALYKKFMHCDLHFGNVLLYEPEKGKYIEYHYHYKNENGIDEVITFKSKYMVKIIDYGRCYFYDSESLNSEKVFFEICRACGPECGNEQGFFRYGGSYYVAGADLLLLGILYEENNNYKFIEKGLGDEVIKSKLTEMLTKVNYDLDKSPGNQKNPYYNVKDALIDLVELINLNVVHKKKRFARTRKFIKKTIRTFNRTSKTIKPLEPEKSYCKQQNELTYKDMEKMGDLYVYNDGRPMEYISASSTI